MGGAACCAASLPRWALSCTARLERPRFPLPVNIGQAHRAGPIARRHRIGRGGEEHALGHVTAALDGAQRGAAIAPPVDLRFAMSAELSRPGAAASRSVASDERVAHASLRGETYMLM